MKAPNTYLSRVFNKKVRWCDVKACLSVLNPCPLVYDFKIWSDSAILNLDKGCLFLEFYLTGQVDGLRDR